MPEKENRETKTHQNGKPKLSKRRKIRINAMLLAQ